MKTISKGNLFVALLTMSLFTIGCGQSTQPPSQAKSTSGNKKDSSTPGKKETAKRDHSGWWCEEHGVLEAECGQCSSKLAKQFQKNGDWCKDHNRPDSQCFICHPENEALFAAKYEAKYGKKPPKREIN